MNLYKITRKGNTDYDQYRGFVVCAHSVEDAHNVICEEWRDIGYIPSESMWISRTEAIIQHIGVGDISIQRGIIMEDFKVG